MLTAKAKYGLKAMAHLAGMPQGKPALIADIAARHGIPKKFLDAILNELRQAKFLTSKPGRGGGYMLARPSDQIIVGDIIRTLDGPLAAVPCVSRNFYSRCQDCVSEDECKVRLLMLEAREALAQVLDKRTLAEMERFGRNPMDEFVYEI
ncbi:Rrf2 family transcriptional regulator [Terrihabitans rhizophilus]|jgi:Rrf2 family protein|uniref:Rrf2 family transcriptional regulator n=1 Tax=Terrihabitans rhizophilus TaxID=3092662 RepID=A0ABU4RJB8_9HYPH|nr:Rrf2 family transcriptional regulator [Terrihabitans sp. PJ23]MDX6804932.1 Rrf2 family transcriptional regulator [Terrihabitans sp. PJ23]